MVEKTQQQTLSVRISDAFRQRLERLRQSLTNKTGAEVSTSEIAKQLLESARDDRLELIDLLADPTAALRQVRRKAVEQLPLSRTEWTLIAYFAQQGVEAFKESTPNRVSRESLSAVLDAFAAVYELRRDGPPSKDRETREPYYLGNLPPECRPSTLRRADREETATPEIVRRTVAQTRARLDDPTWTYTPIFVGRNLYVLLEDERLAGAEMIHRALWPYWPALWQLAARGHYVATGQGVHDPAMRDAARAEMPIPPLSDGDLSVAVMRIEGGDLSVLVNLRGAFGAMYPISGYPKLSEFRTMLTTLAADRQRQWSGAHFFGYVAGNSGSADAGVWFRGAEHGITVGLSLQDWASLQALFQRAWDSPDVRRVWDTLTQDYGEL